MLGLVLGLGCNEPFHGFQKTGMELVVCQKDMLVKGQWELVKAKGRVTLGLRLGWGKFGLG